MQKLKRGWLERGLSFTIVGGLVFMKVAKVSFSDIFSIVDFHACLSCLSTAFFYARCSQRPQSGDYLFCVVHTSSFPIPLNSSSIHDRPLSHS